MQDDIKKKCSKCFIEKALDEFHKQSAGKFGRRPDCRVCRGVLFRAGPRTTPEYQKERVKRWRQDNIKKFRAYKREYIKSRRKSDVQVKLRDTLRCRIRIAIKAGKKSGSAVKDLGCSLGEFKLYLESKFQPGMTWDNYGHDGWHIDHIIPLAHFDLTDREQFLIACNYKNMQPLWAKDNFYKNDKLNFDTAKQVR